MYNRIYLFRYKSDDDIQNKNNQGRQPRKRRKTQNKHNLNKKKKKRVYDDVKMKRT